MARTPITITNLDFDGIKQSLTDFLKSKNSPIKDYAYDGATFNILLDILSANTHYNALYANFVGSEMFLDSAMMRSSIVSIAKEVGYVPRSCNASKATINVSVSPEIPGTSVIVVPNNTKFVTNVSDVVYPYFTAVDQFLEWNGTAYVGDIDIVCGNLFTQSIVYEAGKRLYIESDGVDTSTLLVQVQTSISDTTTKTYARFDKIIDLNAESLVYFLTETDLKRYIIQFGDDVLGKALVNDNIIKLSYIAANLNAPVGATNFMQDSGFYPGYTTTITSVYPSSQPADIEDIESIRRNVHRYNQAQERSVIADDYIYHIKQTNPDIKDVIVWGGEDNEPPQYGKVFSSIILNNLTMVPSARKVQIIGDIKNRSTMNIRPVIVDPEYFKVIVDGFVRYNSSTIGLTAPQLKTDIVNTIRTYSETELERFNSVLALSVLSGKISDIDAAISSVVFNFNVIHSFIISSTSAQAFTKKFGNAIRAGTLKSSKYIIDGDVSTTYDLEDDGLGKIIEYKFADNLDINKTYLRQAGSIDYVSGRIDLVGIIGEPINGTNILDIDFSVDTTEISSGFNQILSIDANASGVRIEVRGQ